MPEAKDHHSLSCTNYEHGDSQVIENGFRLSKPEHSGPDPGKCLNTCLHFIHVESMGQKMLCKLKHIPHQGQSVCALEDQALYGKALIPKLQIPYSKKQSKHRVMAGSGPKARGNPSRIRSRDTETMVLRQSWDQRGLSALHLHQK